MPPGDPDSRRAVTLRASGATPQLQRGATRRRAIDGRLTSTTGIPYMRVGVRANLVKHGVDFVDAVEVFADPLRVERVDRRREYAEERRQAVGTVRGQVLFVVYTLRGEVRRLISARRASSNERRAYYAGSDRAGR